MVNEIHVKSVLNKTKHRDAWFLDDYTLNPYSAGHHDGKAEC
jgi:hypothetical protein